MCVGVQAITLPVLVGETGRQGCTAHCPESRCVCVMSGCGAGSSCQGVGDRVAALGGSVLSLVSVAVAAAREGRHRSCLSGSCVLGARRQVSRGVGGWVSAGRSQKSGLEVCPTAPMLGLAHVSGSWRDCSADCCGSARRGAAQGLVAAERSMSSHWCPPNSSHRWFGQE